MRPSLAALLLLLLAAAGCGAVPDARDDEIVYPEYWFHDVSAPRCVLKVTLDGGLLDRKRRALDFIARAFNATERWTKDFNIAGVDYRRFEYFHVIGYENCDRFDSRHHLGSLRGVTWREVAQSRLVSALPADRILEDKFGAPRGQFVALAKRCAIQARFAQDSGRSIIDAYDKLGLIIVKYRISIFDFSFANDRATIVFGRQCTAKQQLYHLVVELALREGFGPTLLQAPDFDPNLEEYLSTRPEVQRRSTH